MTHRHTDTNSHTQTHRLRPKTEGRGRVNQAHPKSARLYERYQTNRIDKIKKKSNPTADNKLYAIIHDDDLFIIYLDI